MQTVVIDHESAWGGDIKLHIDNKEIKGEIIIYSIASPWEGASVGFELHIPHQIDKFGSGVVFKSLGESSDRFIKLLYSTYNLNVPADLKFVDSITCKYANLNDLKFKGDGTQRVEHINYLKVFLEGASQAEYGEVYINIDETHNQIELEEKDCDFRPYIAMLLSAE